MTGRFDSRFDGGLGAPPLPLRALRLILRVALPAGTLFLIGLAVWVSTRDQGAPTAVEAVGPISTSSSTSSTTTTLTTALVPSTVGSAGSSQDTAVPPPPTPAPTTPSTTQTTTTLPEATTTVPPQPSPDAVALGNLARSTGLADRPGGTGAPLGVGTAIALTGEVQLVDNQTWYGASAGGDQGWIQAGDIDLTSTGFEARSCGVLGEELPATPLAYRPGTAEGTAATIAALELHRSAACDRVVLYLAESIGDDGQFASTFPEELSIVDLFGQVRIEIADDLAVIPELEVSTIPVQDGEGVAVLAIRPDGRPAFNIDTGPALLGVSFLANPARIVLDFAHISSLLPGVGGGVILNTQSINDALSVGDGSLVLMTGYARLDDGLGEIAFRVAPEEGEEPGSGLAVNANFGGTSRVAPVFRSWFFYETPRVDGEWAEFRFSISGLEPGSYELMLGLGAADPPADIEDPGLYHVFVVEEPQ